MLSWLQSTAIAITVAASAEYVAPESAYQRMISSVGATSARPNNPVVSGSPGSIRTGTSPASVITRYASSAVPFVVADSVYVPSAALKDKDASTQTTQRRNTKTDAPANGAIW